MAKVGTKLSGDSFPGGGSYGAALSTATYGAGTWGAANTFAEETSGAVSPPLPPASYSVPGGATSVTTAAQLITQLATSPAKDIVCEDGTYDNSTYFTNGVGHRVYSRNLHGAVFTAGFQGSASGQRYQGLKFNISSTSKVLGPDHAVINIWGGLGHTILDCYIDANFTINWGLKCIGNDGLILQRCWAQECLMGGFYTYNNVAVAYHASTQTINTISDIDGTGFANLTRGASNSYEGLLLIGHPVTNGVTRIRARDCGRKCVEIFGNTWDTAFSHLDLNPYGTSGGTSTMGIGVYIEHKGQVLTFTNFMIKNSERGFNMEWDNNNPGGAAAHHITITDGTIDADVAATWCANGRTYGMFLDQGTEDVNTDRITFINQNYAGIGYHNPFGGIPPVYGASNVNLMQGGVPTLRSGAWSPTP